ncbi:hypothetical protein LCM28_05615 [Salipiger pacificus]|nr:hypothetical protein [Alloyangia pacifica]
MTRQHNSSLRHHAPSDPQPTGSVVEHRLSKGDRQSLLKAMAMAIGEEREEIDSIFAEMQRDIEAAKAVAGAKADKALDRLTARLDGYADRTATVEAKRVNSDEKIVAVVKELNDQLTESRKAHRDLMEKNAELSRRVEEVTLDAQFKQVVPQLLAANTDKLRMVVDAMLHKRCDVIRPMNFTGEEF